MRQADPECQAPGLTAEMEVVVERGGRPRPNCATGAIHEDGRRGAKEAHGRLQVGSSEIKATNEDLVGVKGEEGSQMMVMVKGWGNRW